MISTNIVILLLTILIVGHLAINVIVELSPFLIAENLVLATLYTIGIHSLRRQLPWSYAYITLIASFSAGRVSRTIISPRGETGDLALQHIPLFLITFATAVTAMYKSARK